MKGFIKILEAIVASIILLTSLTFFFNTQIKETGWGDTLLKIKADDTLAVLVKSGAVQQAVKDVDMNNGIKSLNDVLLNTNLNMMPVTVDYSVQISGIPNPFIYVGCVCTTEEINSLKARLELLDFQYNGRPISLRVAADTLDSTNDQTNVLVMFGYKDLRPYAKKLSRFLERGGTIMIIGDLTQQQIDDGYISNTFGLKWMQGPRSTTGTFLEPNNENRIPFKIEKYYNGISNKPESFSFMPSSDAIEQDESTIVTDGTFSLVKINKEIINGHGRTVWMAQPQLDEPTNNLTKAMLMWGSGELFNMDPIKKSPLTKNFKSSALVYDSDPYEIILTVWKVFQ